MLFWKWGILNFTHVVWVGLDIFLKCFIWPNPTSKVNYLLQCVLLPGQKLPFLTGCVLRQSALVTCMWRTTTFMPAPHSGEPSPFTCVWLPPFSCTQMIHFSQYGCMHTVFMNNKRIVFCVCLDIDRLWMHLLYKSAFAH